MELNAIKENNFLFSQKYRPWFIFSCGPFGFDHITICVKSGMYKDEKN